MQRSYAFVVFGALFLLLHGVRYVETGDWQQAVVPVLGILGFVGLVTFLASLFLLRARPRRASLTYTAAAGALAALVSLRALEVPMERLGLLVALSAFAALVLVLANWVKGRISR